MGDSVNDHWSCSIRLSANASTDRIVDEQADFVRELLTHWFPASCGYETLGTRLGGPLDGVCWSVTRGPFLAELGVQRFVRARSGGAPPTVELRFVANAGHGDACAIDSGLERRVVGWAVVGWGLGSAGLGALWLATQGAARRLGPGDALLARRRHLASDHDPPRPTGRARRRAARLADPDRSARPAGRRGAPTLAPAAARARGPARAARGRVRLAAVSQPGPRRRQRSGERGGVAGELTLRAW